MKWRSDRGAVAVEFAVVLVPLLLILAGIIDYGRIYSAQVTLSAAVREGARTMALQNSAPAARAATRNAAPGLSPALSDTQITVTPATCAAGSTVTVTAIYPVSSTTGLLQPLLSGKKLQASGVMRCNG
jgi:Flp pilus assembly protein TadG